MHKELELTPEPHRAQQRSVDCLNKYESSLWGVQQTMLFTLCILHFLTKAHGAKGGGRWGESERFSWNNFKFLSLTVLGTLLKYFFELRSILMIVFGGNAA